MAEYFKKAGARRIWMSLLGNLLIGVGVAIFKLSAMGNDPFNGMNMALANVTGISYPITQILVNIVFFVIQVTMAREMIGLGTLVNFFLLGYIVNFTYGILFGIIGSPKGLVLQLMTLLVGLLVCGLGLSLYQKSEMGTAPFDAFALILDKRLTKVPYFWCRMLCDGSCALICFLAGGLVGPGTLLSAFGFGPVIAFFNRTVSEPLLNREKQ